MTTKAPTPPASRPRPATQPAPTVRELQNAMGCKPGCRCACARPNCACREASVIASEPTAADRAQGARVTIRKAPHDRP